MTQAIVTDRDPSVCIGQKCGYFTPLEIIGNGGMGRLIKVQLHPDEFAPAYVFSQIMSGVLDPRLLGLSSRRRPDDPEFEAEMRRRLALAASSSPFSARLRDELEKRERSLVSAGYVAAAKMPAAGDPACVARFLREARSLQRMGDHPNIVKYVCFDAAEGRPLLIMEYFPAENLSSTLQRGALSAESALRILVAALKAVHHAHANGVIHRDLKPSNILTNGDDIRITDFGLAIPLDDEGRARLTLTSEIVGTPVYMAPEQINRRLGEIGEWTDVYQLGLTLFHLVTGRSLYDERHYAERAAAERRGSLRVEPVELMLRDIQDLSAMHRVFPRDLVPELSDEVEKLIMMLCQKEILERPTCELALEQVQELLDHRIFAHADPHAPPSGERKRESRTTVILSAVEALMAKRAYDEADACEKCGWLLARAEDEQDMIARADRVEAALPHLARLPRAKFPGLHARSASLVLDLHAMRDDIDAFRPMGKITMEVVDGFERLQTICTDESSGEVSANDLHQRIAALQTRAEQHLDRVLKAGLHVRISGRYLQMLRDVMAGLPVLERTFGERRKTQDTGVGSPPVHESVRGS